MKTVDRKDIVLTFFFLSLTIILYFVPTGFERRLPEYSIRCKGRVLSADNSEVKQFGIVRIGTQELTVKILDGPFQGREVQSMNNIMGKLELDKFFKVGDMALVVLSLKNGDIFYANAQDHYRINTECILLVSFALLLVLFGGWTGLKALLSFVFAAMMIWKILVPAFLKAYDPAVVSLGVVTVLTAAIIFLVGGVTRRGLVAFLGAFLGIATTCVLALLFSQGFHLHGAVKPFSETLLYSGFPNLNLTRIFLASVFMASSGAVMDLAMDVAASMDEVIRRHPRITFREAVRSGFRVGRAVVGTMTTTLLLAYSSSYITLLMVFMAQGVPLANMLNLNYVAAEILNTIVGSFGLVTVAPFTAFIGALIYTRLYVTDASKTAVSRK
ncbi:MAG: YibE/F family protein [Deltaproteobacteria bacterium]|nr:YibE/F family protein [Deltaproteobacteria bacterium]